ncbi:hypothetical protein [Siccibacter colletis]|uniref:Uncharacterized protein n=1 Tax=Siccibacter colletis TaxID=1505757 RepID=A0ABY6JBG4_9ENTR|nr:hypothetical protein [Siccibacter colletis]UYU31180.1 hypothetical protein KFZ77_15245 [Siccibacter colletis]
MITDPLSDPRTQLKSISSALRKLHKALVDLETERFGNPGSPFEHLQLLTTHPQFAWLRQISEILVEIDERLDDKENPVEAATVENYRKATESQLALGPENGSEFHYKYLNALQESTQVAMAHGELRHRLSQLAPAA